MVYAVSVCSFFVIFVDWLVFFARFGLQPDLVPAVGERQSQVLGNVLFNYAFVCTVPSWINEKVNLPGRTLLDGSY